MTNLSIRAAAWRLLLVAACSFPAPVANAQQGDRPPLAGVGDAVVTGFSGTVPPNPGRPLPKGKTAIDQTFINENGASVRVFNVGAPGFVWDGRNWQAAKQIEIFARDTGQVFGIALDDEPNPNIYLTATSAYGLQIVIPNRDRTGLPVRVTKGQKGATWMKGQFGLERGGGPGSIWKVDGRTGQVSLFANVSLGTSENWGPGLGNIAFDKESRQLFVSDLSTGMIHRFDLSGQDLGFYDHGVTGRVAQKLRPVPFSQARSIAITSARFDSKNPDTWGLTAPVRRVWGLAVHQNRLYYSVWDGPQIWSVSIRQGGSFGSDPRWELDVPAQHPVSDIVFSNRGAMILAQRGGIQSSYDYSTFARPDEARVLRFWLEQPDNPRTPSRWIAEPEEYAVGFRGEYRNTNGGVDLGYGYRADGRIDTNSCESSLWTTGQSLRDNPTYSSQLRPGGPFVVHGIQGSPSGPVRGFNEPPWTSYFVDYDGRYDDPNVSGHIGNVRIHRVPCAGPVAVYGGPGSGGSPPYVGTTTTTGDCPSGKNPDGTCGIVPIDLKIEKTAGAGKYDAATGTWTFQFTLTVTNVGAPFNGQNVIQVNDVVPAGMTFTTATGVPWACSVPPVISSGALTCTYTGSGPTTSNQSLGTITITATTKTAGKYENCSSVGPGSAPWLQETTQDNNRACVPFEVPFDVKLDKSARWDPVPYGYFLAVTNVGAEFDGKGVLTITDVVPAGFQFSSVSSTTWDCSASTFPITAGGTLTCSYIGPGPVATGGSFGNITINGVPTGPGPWENCASVGPTKASGLQDSDSSNDRDCAKIPSRIDVELKKTAAAAAEKPGDFIFTLNVNNVGAAFNSTGGAITVTDPIPAGMTVNSVSATGGWTCVVGSGAVTCTFNGSGLVNPGAMGTITVNATAKGPGPFENCANVAANPASGLVDTNQQNNTFCAKTPEEHPNCDLEVVKSRPTDPTLALDPYWKNASIDPNLPYLGFCTPGMPCIFTITIKNKSTTACNGTIAVGEKTGSAMNINSITPQLCTPNPTTAPFTCLATVNLAAGASTTYTIDATIPLALANVPGGGPAEFENCFGVGQAPVTVGPWPDYFNETTLGAQGCSKYKSCGHSCHMQDTSSLSIRKVAPPTCQAGQICTYTITVTNTSATTPFTNPISIVEVGPPGSLWVPAGTTPPWGCQPYAAGNVPAGPNVVDCKYPPSPTYAPSIPPLGSSTFTVSFLLPSGVTGVAENCAWMNLKPSLVDANAAGQTDDKDCADVTVSPIMTTSITDLSIAKTGGTSAHPMINGYAFHMTVTNVGTSINGQNVITVTDTVPAGMRFDSASGTNWQCDTLPASAGSTITCTYIGAGAIVQGQSLGAIDITATALGSGPYPPFTNCATVGLTPASGLQDTNPANDQACVTVTKPPPGGLIVNKTITSATAIPVTGLVFPVTITCDTFTTTGTVSNTAPLIVNNIPAPSTCTVTEGPPPTPPANVCPEGTTPTWSTPIYKPPSASISSQVGGIITVQNELQCEKSDKKRQEVGSLTVNKTVTSTGPIPVTGLSYPVTVTCGAFTATGTVTGSTPFTVKDIPAPSNCTVTETPPAPPANVCPQGTTPTWSTPTYTPAGVAVSGGSTGTITVHNELHCEKVAGVGLVGALVCDSGTATRRGNECVCRYQGMVRNSPTACTCTEGSKFVAGRGCVRPPECRAPMVLNSAQTACVCPAGTSQRGRTCVQPIDCRPPQIRNKAGTACTCPAGQVQKGRECVARLQCRSPMVANRAGTACDCPAGMTKRGQTCQPSIAPTRLPGGLPGFGGGQGRGGPREPTPQGGGMRGGGAIGR